MLPSGPAASSIYPFLRIDGTAPLGCLRDSVQGVRLVQISGAEDNFLKAW